tara:strand:- start:37 stop:270 length:234 start_codon:yes stop_codon:yes gene_type:complete
MQIANFKSDPLDQVYDFTGAISCTSITWVEIWSADIEIFIFLSYEVAGELRGGWGAWNVVSERAQLSGREKLQSVRR